MQLTYFQTINQASQAEKTNIFESTFAYLVEAPEFSKMTIKQIEEWNSNAPCNLLSWTAKRWIRETKEAYVQRVNQNIQEQIGLVLKQSV